MSSAQPMYRPRDAEHMVLYGVVQDHLEAFLRAAEAGEETRRLPPFIEREFREFLTCGVLAHGFVRLRCEGCSLERLVPFSCKGRGFCPSCGGRRMTERAAHLLDAVLPWVPVRQWVLTMPYRLRYLLAWDHRLSRAVLGVYARALLDCYRRRARRAGIPDGRTGTVTVIQRFGSGLNLNIHFHALVLDGVFAEAGNDALDFHPALPPTDEEVTRLLVTVYRRVARLLRRRGLDPEAGESVTPDPLAEESASLAGISGASVLGRIALGPRAGGRVRRLGQDPDGAGPATRGPRQAELGGFDLHANVWIPGRDRVRLERLCRYLLRPPLAQERLRRRADGRVLVELRKAWRDGTTHLLLEPLVELLEKLAALTPRPEAHLILYHGVLAPHAAWRQRVVGFGGPQEDGGADLPSGQGAGRPRYQAWATLMQRAFGLDVLACPRCGGPLRLVATISDPAVVEHILAHLGLVPAPRPPGPAPPAATIAAAHS